MNLQQLEYIVALDKHKSFSKAAEACFISQATLSTMVKRLEDELDIIIFDRKNNPIITTDCGKELIKEAQKVVFHSNRLKQLSSEIKGIIEGVLNIGIIPTVAGNLLHRVVPTILEKYPNLKLNIQEITTNNIINKLKANELDAGIVSTPLNIPELEEEILYYEKLMVYDSMGSSQTMYISPEELDNEKIWLLEKGNCITEQIINVCSLNSKKINSNLNFQPNSFESLLNIVDKFEGLTLIPELYFLDLPNTRKNFVKDFVTPFPVREISMIYYRPYAKLRLIKAISNEIEQIIRPILQTSSLKTNEMKIAKM
jgi:LysR family hydrogen peroxide-inducible transcriptional activator